MPSIPIPVNHLFAPLDKKLLELLRSLEPEQWNRYTVARKWRVHDVAAHLLDGNLRDISLYRDRHQVAPAQAPGNYRELVDYLNTLNADWVQAFARVSPQMIIQMLAETGPVFTKLITSLSPFDRAVYSVAWAGEQESQNWFHVARQYTEKWIHQQQIRDAVNSKDLLAPEFFVPAMEVFMRALPYTFRDTEAETGAQVRVDIDGVPGASWAIQLTENGWQHSEVSSESNATVNIDPDTAWKLFSRSMIPEEARKLVHIEGDERLGRQVLEMVSVMA